MAVTGMAVVVMLVAFGAVDSYQTALYGFSQPVAYFLIGVLTLGLAVSKSGLANRMARFFLQRCRGRRRTLYTQLLLAFPALTLVLPSATTRTGILIHVYAQALELSGVRPESHLSRAIMMALNSINRLASTVLLTGGITPCRVGLAHRPGLLEPLVRADERALRRAAFGRRGADLQVVPARL